MKGGHIGERAAALVDGELGHDARDRALAHLAICADCRAEVEAQRRLKARLAGLVDCPVPTGLLTRLVGLAEPGEPLAPRGRHVPGSSRPATVAPPGRFASPRAQACPKPTRTRNARLGRRTRPGGRRGAARARLAAATLVVVAVTMTTAFALGGDPSNSAPLVRPAVDRYAVEHASAVSGVPLTDPAITVVSAAVTGNLGSLATSPGPAESPAPVFGPDAHDPVLTSAAYLDTARS